MTHIPRILERHENLRLATIVTLGSCAAILFCAAILLE
jgi:hypothetical protein